MSGAVGAASFLLGLLTGTGSTLTTKVIYSLSSLDSYGNVKKFEKPQTTTWAMFLGMIWALPAYAITQMGKPTKITEETMPLNWGGKSKEDLEKEVRWYGCTKRTLLMLAIPSMFDLAGTALAQLGLMYCTVSLYQLVRCGVMVIVAFLRVTVLKEPFHNYQWAGLGLNTFAMLMVSSTSFFGGREITEGAGGRDPRIGVGFLLLSCCVQGSQYVFEEVMMKNNAAHPLLVVGMEGFWGTVLMPIFIFPITYYLPGPDGGSLENIGDSWVMIKNSPTVMWVLIIFIINVFFYNVFCCYVTYLLSAVWHAILDNFRPVTVWTTDLLFYYVFFHGAFGETWTRWSWLQLGGMFMLFFGTAVFDKTIKLPCIDYSAEHDILEAEGAPVSSGFLTKSPLLTRSPRRDLGSMQMHTHTPSGRNPHKNGRPRSSSNQ